MMTQKFFIDTADIGYIKQMWNKLEPHITSKSLVGITTNPNALAKVNCTTLEDLGTLLPELCKLTRAIRGDEEGVVYVQVPNSVMTPEDILSWATYVNKFNGHGAHIGLKIPHFSYVLRLTDAPELKNMYLNVTGISDSSTIIKALSYENVHYASIIPGRMEEVGINADEHLAYLRSNNFKQHQGIIAGSMRTINGLKKSIYYGTVPTIGTRVWDLIQSENLWQEFSTYWDDEYTPAELTADYTPTITSVNVNLSSDFFAQMDSLGNNMYEQFLRTK